MVQLSMDNVYRLWEYTSQQDWEGVRAALRNDDVWDEFGDEAAEEIVKALDEIEREEVEFPQNAESLYSTLTQYIS